MISDTVDILLSTFQLLISEVFTPLASSFDLYGLLLGIFITFSLYRFVFIPLFTGSTGVGKFIGSGSDHARKKDDP